MVNRSSNKMNSRLAIARAVGKISLAWGQVGLGTIYRAIGRFYPRPAKELTLDFEPDCAIEIDVFEPYWGPTIVAGRSYEPELRHLLRRVASLDPIFIDCGANIGYWSIIASSSAIGLSRVVAIEPNPSTFAALRKNASLNYDRFLCLDNAVSSVDGEICHLESHDQHAICRISCAQTGVGPTSTTITVDTVLSTLGWTQDPFVVKLDVEGHEQNAIIGAFKSLEADHLIFFEDFYGPEFPVLEYLLNKDFQIFYVSKVGKCSQVNSVTMAKSIAAVSRKCESSNFVATRSNGRLASTLRTWSAS